MRVFQHQVIEDWLVNKPDAPLMEPLDALGAGTELVRIRNRMLVPFHYVWLLLQRPLMPCEAWTQLAGALYNDSNAPSCQPLINWLRVALI